MTYRLDGSARIGMMVHCDSTGSRRMQRQRAVLSLPQV
jgi:hypothetical protein